MPAEALDREMEARRRSEQLRAKAERTPPPTVLAKGLTYDVMAHSGVLLMTGGRWRELASFFTTPGFCRERMTVFLAVDVDEGEAAPEDDEQVEVIRWPLAEIAERLDELEDAKTLAGLLLFLRDGDGSGGTGAQPPP